MKLRHDVEKTIRDNEILGDWVQARQNIRQFKYPMINASKKALNATGKLFQVFNQAQLWATQ